MTGDEHAGTSLQDQQLDNLPPQPPGLLGLEPEQPWCGRILPGVPPLPFTRAAGSERIGNASLHRAASARPHALLEKVIIVPPPTLSRNWLSMKSRSNACSFIRAARPSMPS